MMMMNDETTKFIGGGGRLPAPALNGEFIKKPGKGWLHSDESIQEGITYTVKYVGFIGVKESMKSLSFDVRTQVARESIRRVAESAKCINLSRRSRVPNDEHVNRILSNACVTQWSGMTVLLHINTQVLKVTQLECNDTLFQHTMQNISFACGGDSEIQDFIAYVAKDDVNGRACYVFECGNNLANSVITTIGQAFELRFKKFLNSMPTAKPNKSPTHSSNSGSGERPPMMLGQQQQPLPQPSKTTNVNTALSPNRQPPHSQQKITIPTPPQMGPPTMQQQQQLHHHHHHQHHQYPLPASQQQQHHHQTGIMKSNGVAAATAAAGLSTSAGMRIDESLGKMPWFHGLMSRDQAEKLLTRDGHYLVRETNKTADKQYVLSGRYKGECRHIFLVDPSGVIRTKDRVFDNICHLIQYHQDNKIPIISKENELLLEHPVCCR